MYDMSDLSPDSVLPEIMLIVFESFLQILHQFLDQRKRNLPHLQAEIYRIMKFSYVDPDSFSFKVQMHLFGERL